MQRTRAGRAALVRTGHVKPLGSAGGAGGYNDAVPGHEGGAESELPEFVCMCWRSRSVFALDMTIYSVMLRSRACPGGDCGRVMGIPRRPK